GHKACCSRPRVQYQRRPLQHAVGVFNCLLCWWQAMKRATLFQIPREGWLVLIPLIGLLLVLAAAFGWRAALPAGVLVMLAVLFFHDRPRYISAEPLAVIAPVDGVVQHRREGYDPFLDREAIKISIRVRLLCAYYLRSPVEGTLKELDGKAELLPAAPASWIRTDEGDDVALVVSAGSLLGARPCLGSYGVRVGQGRSCGIRRLARVMDVY